MSGFYDRVIPVFVSMTLKAHFDYDKSGFQEIAEAIVFDLIAGNDVAFEDMRLPA